VNRKAGFDATTDLAFRQFESFEILAVPQLYDFDDLAVFVAKIRLGKEVSRLPFTFAHEPDGTFGFLVHRSRNKTTYDLVQNWIFSWRFSRPKASVLHTGKC